MPGRTAASGGRRPSSKEDAINVAMPTSDEQPDGRAPKRIKLKLSKPKSPPAEVPSPVPSRPKRKSARPVRYTDDLPQKPAEQPARPPVMISLSSRVSTPADSSDENGTPGYSADFLASFIEDTPTNDKKSTRRSKTGDRPKEPATVPQIISSSSSDVEITEAPGSETRKPKIDTPGDIIKKLQAACHALSSLNFVSGAAPATFPPLPERPEPGVNNLLLAATDGDSHEMPPMFVGALDYDLTLLCRNAMQIFRSIVVTKNQLAGRFRGGTIRGSSSSGRVKRGDKGPHSTELERYAMHALEALIDGSGLNVNCVVSAERMHLTWHLYKQLYSVAVAPNRGPPNGHPLAHQIMQPPPIQAPPSPHQFMHAQAQMIAQQQHYLQLRNQLEHFSVPQASAPPPAPHQFLFREQIGQPLTTPHQYTSSYLGPLNSNVPSDLVDRVQAHAAPNILALPRTGQTMKLSFPTGSSQPGALVQPVHQVPFRSGSTQTTQSPIDGHPSVRSEATPTSPHPVPMAPVAWSELQRFPHPGAIVLDD